MEQIQEGAAVGNIRNRANQGSRSAASNNNSSNPEALNEHNVMSFL